MPNVHINMTPDQIRQIIESSGIELSPKIQSLQEFNQWLQTSRLALRPGQLNAIEIYWEPLEKFQNQAKTVSAFYLVLQGERMAQPGFPNEGGVNIPEVLMNWANAYGPLRK